MKVPDARARFIQLNWTGPFSLGPNGFDQNLIDGCAPRLSQLKKLNKKAGIYIFIGDHPIYGARSLLYIGKTLSFERRMKEHHYWLCDEWRVEVYFAKLENKQLLENAEKLLVCAHSPPYNSHNIESPMIDPPIRIWNVGRFWRLFPEISSAHPWYLNKL